MRSTKQVKYVETYSQPIVIIGFMGCGKSTLGRRLARVLKLGFIDLDQQIVATAGCTVAEIFEKDGEKGFRRQETRALKAALKPGHIVALGGGTVSSAQNRKILAKHRAHVVWIDPSWRTLWQRLGLMNARVRPLLWNRAQNQPQSERKIKALWSRRRAIYRRAADVRMQVGNGFTEKQALTRLLGLMTLVTSHDSCK